MKKILCLTLFLMLIPLEFALAQETISIVNDIFRFEVSVTSDDELGNLTIQMLDAAKTTVYYNGEAEGGGHTVSFAPFEIINTAPSGDYIIRVGGLGRTIIEKPIKFINLIDRANALRELDSALKAEIEDCLKKNVVNLDINIDDYLRLDPEWRERIIENISLLDLSISADGSDVGEKLHVLRDTFGLCVEAAGLMSSESASAAAALIESAVWLDLETDRYYAQLSDTSWVGERIAGHDFSFLSGIETKPLYDVFDGAVLTGVINQLDWGTGRDALSYYGGRGLIDIDYTAYDKLSESNKALVFKELKKAGITDYTKLRGRFEEIVKNLSGGGGTPIYSGGGGGSSTVSYSPPAPETREPVPDAKSFIDLDCAEWSREAVLHLAERGVVEGRGEGRFFPCDKVTREEFVKMVVLGFGLSDDKATADFDDVKAGDWCYPYVAAAKKAGIIRGTGEKIFGAGSVITRQDMAVIIYEIYKLAGHSGGAGTGEFSDFGDVSDYAREAVAALYRAGVVNGTGGGRYSPHEHVTRAQAAKVVYETLRLLEVE